MSQPELSIVIPCHNEEENIPILFEAFSGLVTRLPKFELIFVDDGSRDKTLDVIRALKNQKSGFEIRLVKLSRNFGHQLALLAGMQTARGQACVSIDADLQDPPEVIIKMVEEWRKGSDVVLGQRTDRSTDSFFKRFTATLFYRAMSYMTKGEFPQHVGDFRLIDRRVLEILIKLKDVGPYWRGLVIWVGFKRALVPYKREERRFGETKYPFWKMFSLALDAVFAFSKKPLQIASIIGIVISLISFLYGIGYIVLKIAGYDHLVAGWTSIVSLLTFLGGLQLVCLGIMGQYVGRIYEQALARPLVITDKVEQVI